jgi:UDP-3-O-[3-hydroxymyristoyl] glucosamine N-acyltransferase
MKTSILLADIIEFLGDDVISVFGDPNKLFIKYLKAPDHVDEFTLDWINPAKMNKQNLAEQSKANAILVGEGVEYSTELQKQGKVLIVVKNPKLAVAKAGNRFFVKKPEGGIHPSATIHPEAIIGKNIFVGANAVIGKSKIGDNARIYPNVTIYDRTTIGNNVAIHSGAAICSDGLGCHRMADGQLFEFPQLGGVIIEDDVYIGSNTHIASGSLSDTIIGKGSKINGLCFIGSNCQLGQNVWITGSTMLAGSVIVGHNTSIFSNVIVRDQCRIGEKATIGMGAVVTKNVPDEETWIGNPAKKIIK